MINGTGLADFRRLISYSVLQISSVRLREIYSAVYETQLAIKTMEMAQSTLTRSMEKIYTVDQRCKFIAGWRAIHGTSPFVSALIIRVLRLGNGQTGRSLSQIHHIAWLLGEIIAEDVGIDGERHSKLFSDFGKAYCGTDYWSLDQYRQVACDNFRDYNEASRVDRPVEQSLLALIASESWNSAEFNLFLSIFPTHSADERQLVRGGRELQYLEAHADEAENRHMKYAAEAFEIYCNDRGLMLSDSQIESSLLEYLENIGFAYAELRGIFER